ncbi:MAG: AmmeMemoRadiSam system protein B, partial [Clostridium sp.]|nr:AmmeMemoRadiSam system protein B [Clostridium sp.]
SMGDYIYGNFNEFKNVDISFVVQLDTTFSEELVDYFKKQNISHAIKDNSCHDYKLDHGSTVPLYFIDKYYKNYKLVTISSSIANKDKLYEVGKAVRKVCEMQEKKIVLIASCDVQSNKELRDMHENPYEKRVNRRILESIDKLEVFKDYDTESTRFKEVQKYGLNYISFLLGALAGREISGILLSYERPFGTGYGVMKFKTT